MGILAPEEIKVSRKNWKGEFYKKIWRKEKRDEIQETGRIRSLSVGNMGGLHNASPGSNPGKKRPG
jgi:hypothetical protein